MTEQKPDGTPAESSPWAAGGSSGTGQPQPQPQPQPQAPTEQVLFGSAYTPPTGQQQPYPAAQSPYPQPQPGSQPRRSRGGVLAGVTVLALVVGGVAGAAGGYLVADSQSGSNGPSVNALDQAPPARQTAAAPSGTVEAAAEKVLPSVVQLQVQGRSSAGEGSGFVISSDGLIVTNNHVIAGAAQGGQIVAVFENGSTARATIVGRDPDSDVAVVKAQGVSGVAVAELGRSDDLRVGQSVVAIGSPFELSGTVTSGIVSALHRPTRAGGEQGEQRTVLDAIQTDAAINPGNSGGPLVDLQGRVIGINSAIYSPRTGDVAAGSVGIGFAIPIDQARRTADEIAKTGKATQTVLGVQVRDAAQGGASIDAVTQDGPAAKAGLQQGDVVTRLNDRRIDSSDALVAAVRAQAPGDTVKLVLGDGSRTVDVTLSGQPVEPN
ncbi:MAG TPA: trypsin-like peptidase domain-containing protein [Actinophytocola sp.]|uniref:S1C family serine protease n=1 Tax=Actinophytocola sp. TaxID=1872138 RepID=UPI002DB7908F|nr:trypsin-like peptidase domain-containing protein [Actinophytocola sp.]HEU5475737.1 trypsin-like peptidase domain-containing protein [Actinophytocola sp.]